MNLNRLLFDCMSEAATDVAVAQVVIGSAFTAVRTANGRVGIAATGFAPDDPSAGCRDAENHAGRPAIELLAGILTAAPIARTIALALINALNQPSTLGLAEDPQNRILFDRFGILTGARVAMVGYFPPLVRFLEARKIPLIVIDDGRGIGDKANFYKHLQTWADVLLLTATSLLNGTTEDILARAGPRLKTVILGPSTPMLPQAFDGLPVHMLAGSAVTDGPTVLAIVRSGGGARDLKPVLRKVYQTISTPWGSG